MAGQKNNRTETVLGMHVADAAMDDSSPAPKVSRPYAWVVFADHMGLLAALQLVPLAGLGAAAAFYLGKRHYGADLQRLTAGSALGAA